MAMMGRSPVRASHGDHLLRRSRCSAVATIIVGLAIASPSRGDGLSDDDRWRYRTGSLAIDQPAPPFGGAAARGQAPAVDAGVVAATPAALSTGLAEGVGAGLTIGNRFTWGARLSWATTTESTIGWTVTHDDFAARVTGGAHALIGRGSFGLQLAVGATAVHETRHRVRGDLAGAMGTALETTATALGPAGELSAVIRVHLGGAWTLVMTGGPSLTRFDGKLHAGVATQLGVAWQL
jgi:hypothetical protein